MSKNQRDYRMPPGLRTQIIFAVLVTLCALIVLPTALSADGASPSRAPASELHVTSAGTVKTTMRDFKSRQFTAASFADWD